MQDRPHGPVRGRRGRIGRGLRGRIQEKTIRVGHAARPTRQGEEKKADAAQEKLTKARLDRRRRRCF